MNALAAVFIRWFGAPVARLLAPRIARLPRWLRPAIWSSLAIGAIVALRILFAFPAMIREPRLALEAMVALVAASAAGACGGLSYTLIGRRLLLVPRVGRYLTGIVCVSGYLLPLMLVAPRILPVSSADFDLSTPVNRWVWLTTTVLFGIVIGHSWFPAPEHRVHR